MVKDFTKKEKLSFREIVLRHLENILKIAQSEFRGTYNLVKSDGTIEEIPDQRECYVRAIENFAYVLIGFFDDTMEKKYDELIGIFQMSNAQLSGEYAEEIEKIYGEGYQTRNKTKEEQVKYIEFLGGFFLTKKINTAKKLFIQLNLFLYREDYLKTAIYGEERDEVVEEGEEE